MTHVGRATRAAVTIASTKTHEATSAGDRRDLLSHPHSRAHGPVGRRCRRRRRPLSHLPLCSSPCLLMRVHVSQPSPVAVCCRRWRRLPLPLLPSSPLTLLSLSSHSPLTLASVRFLFPVPRERLFPRQPRPVQPDLRACPLCPLCPLCSLACSHGPLRRPRLRTCKPVLLRR